MYEELNSHTGRVSRHSRESLITRLRLIGVENPAKIVDEIDAGAVVETDHQEFRTAVAA
jgi:hypothetical protein